MKCWWCPCGSLMIYGRSQVELDTAMGFIPMGCGTCGHQARPVPTSSDVEAHQAKQSGQ